MYLHCSVGVYPATVSTLTYMSSKEDWYVHDCRFMRRDQSEMTNMDRVWAFRGLESVLGIHRRRRPPG